MKKKFRAGDRVVILGNAERHGVIDGRYKKLYVVILDKSFRVGKNEIMSMMLAHPDNIYHE